MDKKAKSTQLEIVAHADWGKNPAKRWCAVAQRRDGKWMAEAARPIGRNTANWFTSLQNHGNLLLGVDFPLGLPLAYAEKIGVENFVEFLNWLQTDEWASFFEVADSKEAISLHRPFYPARAGGTKQQHLIDGLDFTEKSQLYRQCDLATSNRRAAAPMFWTMGAQQVGKQMLTGWRELVLPYLDEVVLWPFQVGKPLSVIGNPKQADYGLPIALLAECYPGEFYHHLGIRIKGKGDREKRATCAGRLLEWAGENEVGVSAELHTQITEGFPNDDAFDAVIGLFGMLNVVLGNRPAMPNLPEKTRQVEGWLFGQISFPT